MNYTQAVEQAAAALVRGEDANWELARLTWENTFAAGDIRAQADRVSMDSWCRAIREIAGRQFTESTGKVYKAVWAKFQSLDPRDRPHFSEALRSLDNESRDWDMRKTRVQERFVESIDTLATPEQKREVATRLMQDPAIADAVIEQPAVRRAVYESLNRQEAKVEARHNAIRAADPVGQQFDRSGALLDLEKLLRTFAEQARALVAAIGPLPEHDDETGARLVFIRQSFVAADDALDSVRTLLSTGKSDIDSFLADVLKGER